MDFVEKPIWKNRSLIARIEAVEKLTDRAILADIAKTDSDEDVRRKAVGKLTDQNLLADIAKNDSCLKPARSIRFAGFMISDEYVRTLAIKKLTDQNILAEIAKAESNGHIRKAAVEKLNGLISKPIPMTDNSYSHMNGYKITSRTIQFRESSKFYRTIFNPELFIIKNDKEKAAFNNLMHELSSTRRECTNPIAENVDYPYFVIEGDAIECGIRYGMWYTYGSDAHKLAMHIVLSDMTAD